MFSTVVIVLIFTITFLGDFYTYILLQKHNISREGVTFHTFFPGNTEILDSRKEIDLLLCYYLIYILGNSLLLSRSLRWDKIGFKIITVKNDIFCISELNDMKTSKRYSNKMK